MFNIYLHAQNCITQKSIEKLNDFNIKHDAEEGTIAGTLGKHDIASFLEEFPNHLISICSGDLILSLGEIE